MRVLALTVAALTALAVNPARAQTAQCAAAAVAVQDACYMALDLFHYVTPQLGISLTGGNVIQAQGGTTGGLPHFSLGVRFNVVAGNLPELQTPSVTGPAFRTTANPYPTRDQYLGLPAADVSLGLFRGLPVGPVEIGGLDALASATYIPTVARSDAASIVSIEPDTPVEIGYGARLGLIDETVWIPGIGVSVMFRDAPTTSIIGSVGTDSLRVTDFTLKTMSWRVTTGKSFVGFTIAAGVGQDQYDAATTIEAIVNRPVIGRVTTGSLTGSQKITRTNYFANFALNVLLVKLVAEAGMISGGTVTTSNVFDIDADASRTYGSVGVRIGY